MASVALHRLSSRAVLRLLGDFESRNVTCIAADGSWPIIWERARGAHVWDRQGRRYLDLTAAFGVAVAGHANPRVVQAGRRQMGRLLHAMGDVHPHALKAQLARELSRVTFERWGQEETEVRGGRREGNRSDRGKTLFCNSGFEAVEAALKTALLATGRRGVIAFEGGYHGLGYGALETTHRDYFRSPFRTQLGRFAHFVPFPCAAEGVASAAAPSRRCQVHEVERRLRRLFRTRSVGAVLVEPVQGRAGIRIPPPDFLPLVRRLCDEHGALLVLDEVFTGFGRTGRWFACEHNGVVPDLICLGKALTGGFPLSACVGRAGVMDAAWPESTGEALHTSTFLGHPVGCAMALANLEEIRRRNLVGRSAALGAWLLRALAALRLGSANLASRARGLGLMAGLELRQADGAPAGAAALQLVKAMLRQGFILLPEGEHGEVISFTPPLTVTQDQLAEVVRALAGELERL
jgi:4-aminobutyrate aminotransferase-like enzyme